MASSVKMEETEGMENSAPEPDSEASLGPSTAPDASETTDEPPSTTKTTRNTSKRPASPDPRIGQRVTRARATVCSYVKTEDLNEGNLKCPGCQSIICVSEKGCNVIVCRNHSPQFLYFCAHCKETSDNEYLTCSCPKRNTRETRAQVLRQKNERNRENPIMLLDDDSSSSDSDGGEQQQEEKESQQVQEPQEEEEKKPSGEVGNEKQPVNYSVVADNRNDSKRPADAFNNTKPVMNESVHVKGDVGESSTKTEADRSEECGFCNTRFYPDIPNPYTCHNCEKVACDDCGGSTCCDGMCKLSFYCNDCTNTNNFFYNCPSIPEWDLCESCVNDYHDGFKTCIGDCNAYVCRECEDDGKEHWKRCSKCKSFKCLSCFRVDGESTCWCGKGWFCDDCELDEDESQSCDKCAQKWMCGKGKCKARYDKEDEEMACPDCWRQ